MRGLHLVAADGLVDTVKDNTDGGRIGLELINNDVRVVVEAEPTREVLGEPVFRGEEDIKDDEQEGHNIPE